MSMPTGINEVIISSDINSNNVGNDMPGTTYVWDINTGNPVACYKGGAGPTTRGLAMLKKDFLISASHNQPEIILWFLSSDKEDQHIPTRMEVPTKISSLAVSPDGLYCVAGVADKIYVWCVSTGQLLNTIQRHYQDVVCIKFSDNLTFVTGGEDNLVMVWSMTDILALPDFHTKKSKIEPVHIWHDHSLPITDIYVGAGGIRSRVVSSSLDQTCKFWDLATGRLLCSLKFSESLLSVTMNMAENRLYAGGTSGKIYVMDLSQGSARRTTKDHEGTKTNSEKSKFYFLGHQKRVTCLSVSASGQLLVSGSDDCTIKVWNTSSGQCLRTLIHKGSVTNAFTTPFPASLLSHKNDRAYPPVLVKAFEKQMKTTDNVDSVMIPCFELPEQNTVCGRSYPFQSDIFASILSGGLNSRSHSNGSAVDCEEQSSREKTEMITRLQKEINQIKEANDKLFAFSVAQVLK